MNKFVSALSGPGAILVDVFLLLNFALAIALGYQLMRIPEMVELRVSEKLASDASRVEQRLALVTINVDALGIRIDEGETLANQDKLLSALRPFAEEDGDIYLCVVDKDIPTLFALKYVIEQAIKRPVVHVCLEA